MAYELTRQRSNLVLIVSESERRRWLEVGQIVAKQGMTRVRIEPGAAIKTEPSSTVTFDGSARKEFVDFVIRPSMEEGTIPLVPTIEYDVQRVVSSERTITFILTGDAEKVPSVIRSFVTDVFVTSEARQIDEVMFPRALINVVDEKK